MGYQDIPGHSNFLPLYDAFVERAKDGDIAVEVGVALGHSAAYLQRKILDSGKKITVYAVDPWAGTARNGEQQQALGGEPCPGDFSLYCQYMMKFCPEEFELVRPIRLYSVEAAQLFGNRSLDMVLIDGCHGYKSVVADIDAWRLKVKVGGILGGDDHEPNYPGVEKACVECFGPAPENYIAQGGFFYKIM